MGFIPTIYKEEIKQLIEARMVNAVPSGFVGWFKLDKAPDGWVVCNGKWYSEDGILSSDVHTEECTIQAPNLIGRYPLGAISEIGYLVAAGLPNITGETITEGVSYVGKQAHDNANKGAFYVGSSTESDIPTGSEHNGGRTTLYFDAHRSNPIYGNSDTVTPLSTKLLPCMKL